MKSLSLLLLLAFLLVVEAQAQHELYVAAYQWPKGFCELFTCNSLDWSKSQLPNDFSVHGLWPTNLTNWLPCNANSYVNETDPLFVAALAKSWPDFTSTKADGSSLQKFWKDEWNKHGACTVFAQKKYFQQALTFHGSVNIKDRLATVGKISRSATVPTDKVLLNQTLVQIFGKIPNLACKNKSGLNVLQEIRVCYDLQLQVTDCPPTQIQTPRTTVETRSGSCLDKIMYLD